MRKQNIFKILTFGALLVFMASCYDTEVSETIDPTDYPTASFTATATSGNLNEGDAVVIDIALDKPLEWDISFDVVLGETSTVDGDDITISGGEIAAFHKTTQITVAVGADVIVENTEKLAFDIIVHDDLAKKYLLSTDTEFPAFDFDVKNVNAEGSYTINFGWEDPTHHNDLDMYLFLGANSIWDVAATGDNPEVFVLPMDDDNFPDGTYYLGIDVWSLEDGTSTLGVDAGFGKADQSVDFKSGVFNAADMSAYTIDSFPAWGVGAKRIMEITKAGNNISTKFLKQ
jgi:hypothetical protein